MRIDIPEHITVSVYTDIDDQGQWRYYGVVNVFGYEVMRTDPLYSVSMAKVQDIAKEQFTARLRKVLA